MRPPGLYLFCLAHSSLLPPLKAKGLDGQSPLKVSTFQDIAAVWSPVPLEEFCGPSAEERMADLAWIGPRVVRHQGVVAGVMCFSPVLPARFGTIFSSRANLERVIKHHYDTVTGFLKRMTGQEEWAVKGMLERARAKEKQWGLLLAQEADRLGALTPGKRYFQEQRLRAECDDKLGQWLKEVYQELFTDLRSYAADLRERRVLSRKATGSDKDMIFNWALLMPRSAVTQFKSRIQAANQGYAEYGLELECTGPWPPYSFSPQLAMEPSA
jgi:hypothetical protein